MQIKTCHIFKHVLLFTYLVLGRLSAFCILFCLKPEDSEADTNSYADPNQKCIVISSTRYAILNHK